MNHIKPKLNGISMKVGIVVSTFNELITDQLVKGALNYLESHSITDITVVHIPGAFELPFVAKQLAESGKVDGVICLGCVIRGATPHFDFVCNEASRGISELSISSNMPIVFGVLTTNTIDEAIERAGTKAGNKGKDAAEALLQLHSVKTQLKSF